MLEFGAGCTYIPSREVRGEEIEEVEDVDLTEVETESQTSSRTRQASGYDGGSSKMTALSNIRSRLMNKSWVDDGKVIIIHVHVYVCQIKS